MRRKIAKGLWISPQLAKEFDQEVDYLSALVPGRLETGEVGAAALLTFIRLSDRQKLEGIKQARDYALDRILEQLPPDGEGITTDTPRVVDSALRAQDDVSDDEKPPLRAKMAPRPPETSPPSLRNHPPAGGICP